MAACFPVLRFKQVGVSRQYNPPTHPITSYFREGDKSKPWKVDWRWFIDNRFHMTGLCSSLWVAYKPWQTVTNHYHSLLTSLTLTMINPDWPFLTMMSYLSVWLIISHYSTNHSTIRHSPSWAVHDQISPEHRNGHTHWPEAAGKVPTFQIFRGDAQVHRYWGSVVVFADGGWSLMINNDDSGWSYWIMVQCLIYQWLIDVKRFMVINWFTGYTIQCVKFGCWYAGFHLLLIASCAGQNAQAQN